MKTISVGAVQKNFAGVLRQLEAGEEVIVTKRGKPVAKITPPDAAREINWPDFSKECVTIKGPPLSDVVIEDRKDRF